MTNSEMQQSAFARFITTSRSLSPLELLAAYRIAVIVRKEWVQMQTGRECKGVVR